MSGNGQLKMNNDIAGSSTSNKKSINNQSSNIQIRRNPLFNSSECSSFRRILVDGARSVCNTATILTGGDILSNNSKDTNQFRNNIDCEKGLKNRVVNNNVPCNEGTSMEYTKLTKVSEIEKSATFPLIHSSSSLSQLPHDFTRTSSALKLNFSTFLSESNLNESHSAILPPRSESTGQFFCAICYSTPVAPNDFYVLAICRHTACQSCLKSYLKCEINESRTDLTCPQCSKSIHPNDMEVLLTNYPKYILKYQEFMIRRFLLTNPDSRWCPAPDCSYAVIAQGCASCPKIQCQHPECGISFCYHCKSEWHPDQTCDAARAKRNIFGQYILQSSSTENLNLRDDIKPCPKCQVLIVKMDDGSCNHMVCSICKAEFCWLCMKEISDLHYLSPSGCTFWGKKPWSRKKKLMWQLGTLVGAPVGIALVAGICVPAMIIGIPVWVGKKIYARYKKQTKHKRNCALLSGVLGSILLSPVVAGLIVAIGIPILLFYVYGVVPISLCRTGCGVSQTREGSKVEKNEEEITVIANNSLSQLNITQQEALNPDNDTTSYSDTSGYMEETNMSHDDDDGSNLNMNISSDINSISIDAKFDEILPISLAGSSGQQLEVEVDINDRL